MSTRSVQMIKQMKNESYVLKQMKNESYVLKQMKNESYVLTQMWCLCLILGLYYRL